MSGSAQVKPQRLNKSVRFFILIPLLPVFVYLVSQTLYGYLSVDTVYFHVDQNVDKHIIDEINNRIFFISISLIITILSLSVTWFASRDIFKHLHLFESLPFVIPLGLAFGVLAYSFTQIIPSEGSMIRHSYQIYGTSALTSHGSFFEEALNENGLLVFDKYIKIYLFCSFNLFVAMCAVICSGVSCTLPAFKTEVKIPEIQNALIRLESHLFLSAVLLITGIIFFVSYMSWPHFYVQEKIQFQDIVRAMTIFTGFTFSLMIAAFYFPARLKLISCLDEESMNARHKKTKDVTAQNESRIDKLFAAIRNAFGTSVTQKEFYGYTIKIISPILAAWFTTNLPGILPS